MALVLYGPIVSNISGSLYGLTFSTNPAGHTCYTKHRPLKQTTPAALEQQARAHAITALWKTLTDSLRADWNTFAASPPETDYDPFGNERNLSGFQWFHRINTRRLLVGQATDTTPPAATPVTTPNISGAIIRRYGTPNTYTHLWTPASSFPSGTYAILFCSMTPSPGITTTNRNRKLLFAAQVPDFYDIDFGTALQTIFGQYTVGWYCHLQLQKQSSTGIRGTTKTRKQIIQYS